MEPPVAEPVAEPPGAEPVAEPAVEPVAKPCWHKTPGCNLSGKHNGMPCSSQVATGSRARKRKLVD